MIDDGHVSMGASQAPPNWDLGVYQNPLPRHDNNVNQVSILTYSSRQVTYNGSLQSKFVGMMGVELIYATTHTGRGDKRVPPLRENRA